ncbi:MAG: hypothetical protein NTY50_02195 [Methylobacter sp.]|nr:hypothetical protein [Methylobacter sp.]
MKRNKIIETLSQDELKEYKKCVAFHEAGHAAGIHLHNQAHHLPPVFFNINFKRLSALADTDVMAYQSPHSDCIARVEGGRLIESLPPSIDSLLCGLSGHDDSRMQLTKAYMSAFDADIINLLIGPLAEAKHVADVDDELFNHRLISLDALKYYGGSFDLALVNEYLHSFSADKQQQDEKSVKLFTAAFDFVNNKANWKAITQLAGYILDSNKSIICCAEIVSILDQVELAG